MNKSKAEKEVGQDAIPGCEDCIGPKASHDSSTSEKQEEKSFHMSHLEEVVPGFEEAWGSWKAVLSASKKGTLWAEILRLREFRRIAERRPRDVLSMLAYAAKRQWQSFEEEWYDKATGRSTGPKAEYRDGKKIIPVGPLQTPVYAEDYDPRPEDIVEVLPWKN